MLLSLRSDHKEHLTILTTQTTQVVVDFCKLAIDFLHNGPNQKLYTTAASKLGTDVNEVENCVFGLVKLLILACKHKLSEADFRDSILTLGFSVEQQTVIYEFYNTRSKEIGEVLRKLALHELHYKNLEWRFEVQVASRSLLQQVNPIIAMELVLNDLNVDGNGEKAKKIILQTDPGNLVHITDKLQKALNESRSRESRKIQHAFLDS